MKAKVINKNNNQQFDCEEIEIKGCKYYAINTAVGCKYGISKLNEVVEIKTGYDAYLYKGIICSTNPNIDLPQVVCEVEVLAKEHANKVWGIYIDDIDEDCNDTRGNNSISDFKAGYNKSQSTHANSDEDMKEFAIMVADYDQHSQPRKTIEEHLLDFKAGPKVIYYHD